MLHYPVVYSLFERERVDAHTQGTVLVPTIKNLYHIQCQYVDELSSLVWIKLQHPYLDSYYPSRLRVAPGFIPLAFESAAIFFIIGVSSVYMAGFPTQPLPFLSLQHSPLWAYGTYHIWPCAAIRCFPSTSPQGACFARQLPNWIFFVYFFRRLERIWKFKFQIDSTSVSTSPDSTSMSSKHASSSSSPVMSTPFSKAFSMITPVFSSISPAAVNQQYQQLVLQQQQPRAKVGSIQGQGYSRARANKMLGYSRASIKARVF